MEVLELMPPYVQTELGGPDQATDPHAMPLADYVGEVMEVLGKQELDHSEILVQRVTALRWAERRNEYDRMFALLNEPTFDR